MLAGHAAVSSKTVAAGCEGSSCRQCYTLVAVAAQYQSKRPVCVMAEAAARC
jgi:hypothetical protein